MDYIDSDKSGAPAAVDKRTGCVFCDKAASANPAADLVVFKGELAFVLMNLYPYNNGHLMIAPYAHVSQYESLDAATTAEMDALLQRGIRALAGAFRPDGYNVGMNLGKVAGAGIADHLHMHIVPRWAGDVNFMPVIGETKVLPDSLENSYKKIVEHWI
jgi:ATP adenylyltransferase